LRQFPPRTGNSLVLPGIAQELLRHAVGPIAQPPRYTFANLRRAVTAAGGRMQDVAQVLIYLTEVSDMKTVDQVYCEFFSARAGGPTFPEIMIPDQCPA